MRRPRIAALQAGSIGLAAVVLVRACSSAGASAPACQGSWSSEAVHRSSLRSVGLGTCGWALTRLHEAHSGSIRRAGLSTQ